MLRGSGPLVRCHLSLKPVTGTASWAGCALRSNGPYSQVRRSDSQPPPPGATFKHGRRHICATSSSGGAAGGPKSDPPRIFVLGGGFGGLYAAIRLDSLMWPRNTKPTVTLIDQNDRFLFKPLMYELLSKTADESEVAPEYTSLLAPHNVRYIKSKVSNVQLSDEQQDGGVITLADGTALPYDWLVLALGGDTNLDLTPGAKQHALSFSTLQDVQRVDNALTALKENSTDPSTPQPVITVVGAGYAGVELAATVAERMRGVASVHLLSPAGDVLPGQSPFLVEAAEKSLSKAGVTVRRAMVEKVAKGRKVAGSTDLGKKITLNMAGKSHTEEADLVLWTAGLQPSTSKLREGFPFPVSARGTTATDSTLRVEGHVRVFAIGDTASARATSSASPDESALASSPTAQVAMQQADYVAWNIWASINNRPLLPFKYQHLGTMVSFGRSSATVKLNLPVPSELASAIQSSPLGGLFKAAGVQPVGGSEGVLVEGPMGALLRRAAYWFRQPTDDQKLRVGRSWLEAAAKEFQSSAPQNTSTSAEHGQSANDAGTPPPSPTPEPTPVPTPISQSSSSVGDIPDKTTPENSSSSVGVKSAASTG